MMGIKETFFGNEEERAVSPVIGVILMVAITVILAAVIAAFVLDMGDTSANPQAGFQFNDQGSQTEVTINNIERLDDISFQCDVLTDPQSAGGTADNMSSGDWYTQSYSGVEPSVGDTFELDCERNEVVIIGEYDGNEVVMT